MSEVTLEKVDQVRQRTGVSYAEAKHALEVNNGDVLEALIYLEEVKSHDDNSDNQWQAEKEDCSQKYETLDEFKAWLSEMIKKGNISRIKIKRDEKVLIDVPVNAGIAAGVIALIIPQLLIIGVVTAIATKLTIEITKEDGSVEIVNKVVKDTVDDVKDKASDIKEKATDLAETLKDKINSIKNDKASSNKNIHVDNDAPVYTYTVKFDEVDKEE
jgi:translation elongation factor EF-Ts